MTDPNRDRTSEELMAAIRADERGAFDALFRRHRGAAIDYAFRLLFQERDAEDVVQEGFMRIYVVAQRGGFDPRRGSFRTYLYRVIRNLCYDRLAVRSPLNASDVARGDDAGPSPFDHRLVEAITPADRAGGRMLRERITEAMTRLPSVQREAITLRGFEGLSYREIGRILDRPVTHVKILIHRARQTLAALVDAPPTRRVPPASRAVDPAQREAGR